MTVPEESKFHCPVCGHQLREIGSKARAKSKRLVFVVSAAAVILLLSGFAILKNWILLPQAKVAGSTGGRNIILRLSGSNTIGESLMPALAEAFLKDRGATDVHTVPGDQPQEKIVQGTLPGDKSASSIKIAAHGSATAFTSLAESSCEIGMASRRIKPDEAAKLASLGDMLSPASEHILGLDGIAVIVNASNPVSQLSKDEIMHIFTGETADWPKAGASERTIKIYARDDKSGTYDTFKALVLAGKPLAPGTQRFEDSNALSDAVAGDPNGIGFIGLPFIHSAKPVAVSEKGTRSLLPTRLTVATEDYSLSRRLYLYTPAYPANKYTRSFVEFALSKQGQDVVAANGFVAQNIGTETQAVAGNAPEGYRRLTGNAQRLSLDFRFEHGESEPDNKAQADLDRVVALIADLKVSGDQIMLLGFADSTGTPENNAVLSLSRARMVESEFIRRGVKPAVVQGFGARLPVASNDTEEGREKNRRVEVWVKK